MRHLPASQAIAGLTHPQAPASAGDVSRGKASGEITGTTDLELWEFRANRANRNTEKFGNYGGVPITPIIPIVPINKSSLQLNIADYFSSTIPTMGRAEAITAQTIRYSKLGDNSFQSPLWVVRRQPLDIPQPRSSMFKNLTKCHVGNEKKCKFVVKMRESMFGTHCD